MERCPLEIGRCLGRKRFGSTLAEWRRGEESNWNWAAEVTFDDDREGIRVRTSKTLVRIFNLDRTCPRIRIFDVDAILRMRRFTDRSIEGDL